MNKPKDILMNVVCPRCQSDLKSGDHVIHCEKCGQSFSTNGNAILFAEPPAGINPSEIRERGAGKDTAWRNANGIFLKDQLRKLSKDALILDVGAGRGDFLPFYSDFPHILLDVYPYPEIDVVCDLTRLNPLRAFSLDVILLMNVLEHVAAPLDLLRSMRNILKPHGKIIVAIPFYLKIHQAPLDFQRLTHFALHDLAEKAGYSVQHLEGFYDPCGVIEESLRYYRFWAIQGQGWFARKFGQAVLWHMQFLTKMLGDLSVQPYLRDPYQAEYPAPTGYQLVLEKK
ncbi:MAG TPA: methyltransferase domain-containing protein [Anaerolineaceae bacterium]|nr:methyltransferase domain-containing protein [Anaerolineaceae bacterium]